MKVLGFADLLLVLDNPAGWRFAGRQLCRIKVERPKARLSNSSRGRLMILRKKKVREAGARGLIECELVFGLLRRRQDRRGRDAGGKLS